MRRAVRAGMLGAVLVLGGGCDVRVRGGAPGERIDAPPRYVSGKSCPALAQLEAREGALVAAITEDGPDAAFLGRALRSDGGWQLLPSTGHAPFHLGTREVSLAPDGQAFAALYPVGRMGEPPELWRSTAAGWERVPFDVGLDTTRQNHPTVLALDGERAVVSIWETGGHAPHRQRAFLLQEGAWVPLEDYQPMDVQRTFHRGPQGQLWRATAPAGGLGAIRFDAWTGSAWAPLNVEFTVAERGVVRFLLHAGERSFALYDTSRVAPGGRGFDLYELGTGSTQGEANDATGQRTVAPSWRQVAQEPTPELEAFDLSLDSAGRPVVSMWGTEERREVVRSYRLEDGAWRAVYAAHPGRRVVRRPEAAIVRDTLVVGWAESDQPVDEGFAHYSDCELVMERADLSADR